jgi:hypothetical protein
MKEITIDPIIANVSLTPDGESVTVHELQFRSRSIHRQLSSVDEIDRNRVLLDILDVGAEVISRASHHGDLESLATAVEQLDLEAKRIVASTAQSVDQCIEKAISEMSLVFQGDDSPLSPILERFDPSVEGNLIDVFRDLVARSTAIATKRAVEEISSSTEESMDRLAKSLSALERVAAIEEARLAEATRGTAKGVEHEKDTESLLGELVGIGGDSLDDVSTVPGLDGSKRGDKTITPRGGSVIVTEEKCATRMSEAKIRTLLQDAMSNRGAELGMLIVDDESKVPGNQPFHLIDDDKVVVVAERLPLRMVYALFRAKSIERAKIAQTVDDAAIGESLTEIARLVEDMKRALDRFRLLRTEHTKASRAIAQAGKYVDETEEAIVEDVVNVMRLIDRLAVTQGDAAA